jgi:uncharacterized protein
MYAVLQSLMTHDPFLARGRVGRWTWPWALFGCGMVVVMYMSAAVLTAELQALAPVAAWIGDGRTDETIFQPGNLSTYLSMLTMFLPLALVPMLVFRNLHRRAWGDWPVRRTPGALTDFVKAVLAMTVVLAVSVTIDGVLHPERFAVNARLPNYWRWFALGLVMLLVQTFAEEALFKGYLTRVLGAVLPYRWPLAVGLSVAFTSLHVSNTDFAADHRSAVVEFMLSGLVSFAVYFRTQRLAAPFGIHWANNVFALLIVSTQPGSQAKETLLTYTDPVLAAGLSNLATWEGALALLGTNAALAALLLWQRSPLCLAHAIVPLAIPEPSLAPEPAAVT